MTPTSNRAPHPNPAGDREPNPNQKSPTPVDVVYLDPPFNSNADYNVLLAEHSTEKSHA